MGWKAICEIQFADYIYPAFDQMVGGFQPGFKVPNNVYNPLDANYSWNSKLNFF